MIATSSSYGTLRVWDLSDLSLIQVPPHLYAHIYNASLHMPTHMPTHVSMCMAKRMPMQHVQWQVLQDHAETHIEEVYISLFVHDDRRLVVCGSIKDRQRW